MTRKVRSRQLGIGSFGVLLLIPLVLIAALIGWVAFSEARKNYWDDKVRELCAKDGGVRVIEKVYLSDSDYRSLLSKFGELSPPPLNEKNVNAPIGESFSIVFLRNGNPEIRR